MKRPRNLLVYVVIALVAGCNTLGTQKPLVDDLTPLKEARKQEAVQQFEERRDAAEFQAARSAWSRGDRATCRESLDSLLARNPEHRESRLLLADLLVAEGQPQEAREQLQNPSEVRPLSPPGVAIASDTNDPTLIGLDSSAAGLIRRGASALSGGSIDLAVSYFRDAAARNPNDPRIPTASAVAALANNRPDVAIRLADDALTRFDDYVPLLRVLGASYYRKGDYPSSQLVLQQALSLDKSDRLAYFLMGCTLAKLGQVDAAEAHWRGARQLGSHVAGGASVEPPTR